MSIEGGYIIDRGRIVPLEDAVGPRGRVRAEAVLRFQVSNEEYLRADRIWSSRRRSGLLRRSFADDRIQDIGIWVPNTEVREHRIIAPADVAHTLFRGQLSLLVAEPVLRFRMSHHRFLLETQATAEEYDRLAEQGVIDDMETRREKLRLIVGPEDVIKRVFPNVRFKVWARP